MSFAVAVVVAQNRNATLTFEPVLLAPTSEC